MKVVITGAARANLWPIYEYHRDYSQEYAFGFQTEIDRYLQDTLANNPQIGRVFNAEKGIRRLIYRKQYNIYYVLRDNTAYVIFIYDGQMDVNAEIEDGSVKIPTLEE